MQRACLTQGRASGAKEADGDNVGNVQLRALCSPPRVPCWSVADGWKRRESPRSVFLAEEGGEGWLAVEKPAGIERSLGEASDGAGNGVIMTLISPIPSPSMFWGRMCDGAPS